MKLCYLVVGLSPPTLFLRELLYSLMMSSLSQAGLLGI